MKLLEDIFRIENGYAIIDCCPRDGVKGSPASGSFLDLEYEGSCFEGVRTHYTLYMNTGLVSLAFEDRKLDVTCPICREKYELSQDFFNKKLDEYECSKD